MEAEVKKGWLHVADAGVLSGVVTVKEVVERWASDAEQPIVIGSPA